MRRRKPRNREVVYIEREDSSARWLFWGACLGAGLALLYAPRSGEETRRSLQRGLWKLRAVTEETLDDLTRQVGARARDLRGRLRDEAEPFEEEALEEEAYAEAAYLDEAAGEEDEEEFEDRTTAREEMERRLADARRRRRAASDAEEPPA